MCHVACNLINVKTRRYKSVTIGVMQITFRRVSRRTLVEVFLAQDRCLNPTSSSSLQPAAVLVQRQPGPAAGWILGMGSM